MVTFERMLFDFNEYMHYSAILAADAYIDGPLFIMYASMVTIITIAYYYYVYPILLEKIMNIKVSETTGIYISVAINISFLIYIYLEHYYGLLLLLTFIVAALYIIYTDKRLVRIKEFIERLF